MELTDVSTTLINGDAKPQPPIKCRAYKKRWIILLLYCLFVVLSAIQWIQYSVITDVVVKYYNVSNEAVNFSSMIFLILYIPCSFPGSYILDKLGLRISILIGVIGSCIGTWVKIASVDPNKYWVIILGQGILSIFQVLAVPVPPKLAALWFPEKEVSLACSIGIISLQIGIALGFMIPPLLIQQGSVQQIKKGFYIVSYLYAISITVLIPLVYFYFNDAPPTVPSIAQLQIQQNGKSPFNYKKSLKNLFSNRSFMALVVITGVNIGTIIALTILLNQIILFHYPFAQKDIAYLGLLMTCSGVSGSYLSGYVLAKTGKYKTVTIAAVLLTIIALSMFFCLINQSLIVVYIFGICLSFLSNSIYCIGFELGVELTYPELVGSSSGLLALSIQAIGLVITYTYSHLFNYYSELSANLFCLAVVFIGDCSLLLITFDLKRQSVSSKKNFKLNT